MKEEIHETYETRDIPPDRVEDVVAGYLLDDPIRIERIKQPDGNWTVRATFLSN